MADSYGDRARALLRSIHEDNDEPDFSKLKDNPQAIAAHVCVDRLLEQTPGLREQAAADGVVVVVKVPTADWARSVALAWRRLVRGADEIPRYDEDVEKAAQAANVTLPKPWLEIIGPAPSSRLPQDRNLEFRAALLTGRSIYAFSDDPAKELPTDMLRVVDIKVTLPSLDATALEQIIELLCGSRPQESVELSSVTLDDLMLARRPDQAADGYLQKIHALVRERTKLAPITLEQLHGMDEAVTWGFDLVHDLEGYRKGELTWADVDRGILLVGAPGVGKTTFAKALASSCGCPLIAASLAKWQAVGHLGDLLKAMHASFREARDAAPCILLIDEIDSFGDRAVLGHEYRDYSIQVVNGLLEQLDGAIARDGVVVIGACNDASSLDPALVRSGRLDRLVRIPLPDAHGLVSILRYHLGSDLVDADLASIATLALGATGADCARWIRGARRRARNAARAVTLDDVRAEIRGAEAVEDADARRRIAIHEAGHAVAIMLHRPGALISLTLRRSDASAGAWVKPREEGTITRREIEDDIECLLAGRSAEAVICGEPSTGSGGSEDSDLARATALATYLVTAFGFGERHKLTWLGMPARSELPSILGLRPDISVAVAQTLEAAYARASGLIRANRANVETVADLLLEHEALEGTELERLMQGREHQLTLFGF